jgi:DNA uptake protein ComE-like DNA-binding protein
MGRTQINVANPQELLAIPGIDGAKVDTILRDRDEHGPISNSAELAKLLGQGSLTTAALAHIDFAPAGDSAPESAGG